MPDRCTECLYWPAAIRTAEHVATLIPARAYWASCVHCGPTIDLAAAVRVRVTQSGGDRGGRPRDRGLRVLEGFNGDAMLTQPRPDPPGAAGRPCG
jgi:hypothetical protein